MILCIQRVKSSSVKVGNKIVGEIDKGLLVFVAIEKNDKEDYIKWVADKLVNMRIFENENFKMSKSVKDIDGSILIVSQFTLAGNVSKGRRPDFTNANSPEIANKFYNDLITEVKLILGKDKVASGVFGADMEVSIINDGPVTILLEKRD